MSSQNNTAEIELNRIVNLPTSEERKLEYGRFLLSACKKGDPAPVLLLFRRWFNPFDDGGIVSTMLRCMALAAPEGEDVSVHRKYLEQVDDMFWEIMEEEDRMDRDDPDVYDHRRELGGY